MFRKYCTSQFDDMKVLCGIILYMKFYTVHMFIAAYLGHAVGNLGSGDNSRQGKPVPDAFRHRHNVGNNAVALVFQSTSYICMCVIEQVLRPTMI